MARRLRAGNEFSDHVTERQNYLWLAHSKLRACSVGPELLTGALPEHVGGESRLQRGGKTIWAKPFLSGEKNMSHTVANLEYHHFKYASFRRPGDVHIHFFGAATLSFADGIKTQPGDVFRDRDEGVRRTAAQSAWPRDQRRLRLWRRSDALTAMDIAAIFADWGTTNRRAWAVDRAAPCSIAGRDNHGLLGVKDRAFEASFRGFVGDWLSGAPGIPVLMAGMVGSKLGWREAPYVETPASFADLARTMVELPTLDGHPVRIVPGLVCRASGTPDVMRGEETQLFGLWLQTRADRLCVLPGHPFQMGGDQERRRRRFPYLYDWRDLRPAFELGHDRAVNAARCTRITSRPSGRASPPPHSKVRVAC